jgi:hypothetical protein
VPRSGWLGPLSLDTVSAACMARRVRVHTGTDQSSPGQVGSRLAAKEGHMHARLAAKPNRLNSSLSHSSLPGTGCAGLHTVPFAPSISHPLPDPANPDQSSVAYWHNGQNTQGAALHRSKPRHQVANLRALLQRQHAQLEGPQRLVLEVGGITVGLAQRTGVCRKRGTAPVSRQLNCCYCRTQLNFRCWYINFSAAITS